MSKIAIVTDTACDLPKEVQAQYGIHTVPLMVRFGTEQYLEWDLTREEFWRKALQAPPYPGTSQPSIGLYEQTYTPLVEQGAHVLCLTITSKHSGTYNSACAAAQKFPGQVTVFDTLSLSLAQGYQAIAASRAAAEGQSVEEILALLDSLRARTHLYIGLDTIDYLRRGGRAHRVMPILQRVVRVLSIKPILNVVEGELTLGAAARSRQKVMAWIREQLKKWAPAEMLFGIYTRGGSDETCSLVHKLAQQLDFPLEQAMIGEAGPALSCQGGPAIIAAAIVQRAD